MKKLLVCLLMVAMPLIHAQSSKKIVDNYIEAMGGRAKLSSLKSMKSKVTITTMGLEMSGDIWYKSPNKQFSEMEVMGSKIVTAFDGENGWMINPMTGSKEPIQMTEEQLANTNKSSLRDILLDTDKYKLEDLGIKNINGTEFYAIKISDLDGNVLLTKYFDKETYLVKYDETLNTEVGKVFLSYEEYKDINGVKVATRLSSYVNENFDTAFMTVTMSEVQINVEVADSKFAIPQ